MVSQMAKQQHPSLSLHIDAKNFKNILIYPIKYRCSCVLTIIYNPVINSPLDVMRFVMMRKTFAALQMTAFYF